MIPTVRGNISYGCATVCANDAGAGDVPWSNPTNVQGMSFDDLVPSNYASCAIDSGQSTQRIVGKTVNWDRPIAGTPKALFFQLSMQGDNAYPTEISVAEARIRVGAVLSSSLHADAEWVQQRISARTVRQPIGPLFEGSINDWNLDLVPGDINHPEFGALLRVQNTSAGDTLISPFAFAFRFEAIWQDTESAQITNSHTGTAGAQTVNVESPGAFHFHCCDTVFGANFPSDAVPEWEILEAPVGWGYSYADPRTFAAVNGTTENCRRFRDAYNYALWFPPGTTGTFKIRCRITLPFPTRHVITSPVITLNVTPAASLTTLYVDAAGAGNGSQASPMPMNTMITTVEANPAVKYLILLKKGDTFAPNSELSCSSRTALLCISSYGSGARPIWNNAPNVKVFDFTGCQHVYLDGINFPNGTSTLFTFTLANTSDFGIFNCVFGVCNSVMECTDTGSNARHMIINTVGTFRRYFIGSWAASGRDLVAIGNTLIETSDSTDGEGGYRCGNTQIASGVVTNGRRALIALSSHTTRVSNGKSFSRCGWGYTRQSRNICDKFSLGEKGNDGHMGYQFENVARGNQSTGSNFTGTEPSEGAIGVACMSNVIFQDQDSTSGWVVVGRTLNRHRMHNNLVMSSTDASTIMVYPYGQTTAGFPNATVLANFEMLNNAFVINTESVHTGHFVRADFAYPTFNKATNTISFNKWCGNSTGSRFRDSGSSSYDLTAWNALTAVTGDRLLNIPPSAFAAASNYLPSVGTYPLYYADVPSTTDLLDMRGIYRNTASATAPAGPVGLEANPAAPSNVTPSGVNNGFMLTITGSTTEYIVEYGTTSGNYTHWLTGFESGNAVPGVNGTTYYFRVRSRDTLGNISVLTSEFSSEAGATAGEAMIGDDFAFFGD